MLKKICPLRHSTIIAIFLVFAICLSSALSAYADNVTVFGYGYNRINDMTIENKNTTPGKQIPGNYIQISFNFRRASSDRGVGDIKVTIQILDEDFRPITKKVVTCSAGYDYEGYESDMIYLGGENKIIHFWMDISSAGSSNGHYRKADINEFYVNVI